MLPHQDPVYVLYASACLPVQWSMRSNACVDFNAGIRARHNAERGSQFVVRYSGQTSSCGMQFCQAALERHKTQNELLDLNTAVLHARELTGQDHAVQQQQQQQH